LEAVPIILIANTPDDPIFKGQRFDRPRVRMGLMPGLEIIAPLAVVTAQFNGLVKLHSDDLARAFAL
jgi:hypothetical protein